jgi:precorrin-6y C5,15-methyltransferase (decarboxylating) CbiE subunit
MGLIPVIIAGCGPGHADFLTLQVREAAQGAEVLAGAPRLLDLFPESTACCLAYDQGLAPFLEVLAPHLGRRRVVVLVTGDPGLASLAATLARHFPQQSFKRLAGISSVQLAFAEAGLDWMEARILRAHNTLPPWDPAWAGHRGPFALLAGAEGAAAFASEIAERLQRPAIWRCQRLGLSDPSVERFAPEALRAMGCDPLSVLIIEGAHP